MNTLYVQNPLAKQILSVFFAFTVIAGSISPILLMKPNEASAVIPVVDIPHAAISAASWAGDIIQQVAQVFYGLQDWIKEWTLDPILWFIAKLLIRSLTYSIVTWINSGFEGEPQFLLDKSVLFSLIIDENIRTLLYTIANFPELMDSLKVAVLQGIISGFYSPAEQLLRSTFPGGNAAYIAYLADFRACESVSSWECYLEITAPQNNPYGTQMIAMNELSRRLSDKISQTVNDLIEGTGFLSLTECVERNAAGNCTRSIRKTPGRAVAGQLDIYLGSSEGALEAADEMLESIASILDALLNQFITKGLLYLAEGGPESFGSSLPPPGPGTYVGAGGDGWCNPDFPTVDPDCGPPGGDGWCNPDFTATDPDCGPPDTVPPSVTIITPIAGSTISGTITLSANMNDNVGVLLVDFLVDGVVRSFVQGNPLPTSVTTSWDTTNGNTHPCGGPHTHSIMAQARDAAGNVGVSPAITVNMNNPSYCP